jgi:hypothetical protein
MHINTNLKASSSCYWPSHHIFLFLSLCRKPVTLWLVIHRFAKRHNHVACACAVLDELCESPFGIAPSCFGVSKHFAYIVNRRYIPWSVVLDVVLLDLLDVMVGLRVVHALGVLPGIISEKAKDGNDNDSQPEGNTGEESRDNASIFHAESKLGCNSRIDGQEDEPDCKTARDGNHSVFGPEVGDECCFAESSDQASCVKSGSPHPVSSNLTITLWQIIQEDEFRYKVENKRVVETVCYPAEERMHSEEHTLLTELVELRVSIEQTSRDVLIEDTKNKGRHNCEENVVETHRPGLKDDLSGETILEGVPELSHKKCRVLVVEVQDHLGDSLIRPGSVYKQELSKVAELCDRNVGRTCCLKTFNTRDTDADMCCLDHRDIVSAITNSQENGFLVTLDKLDDEGFLQGRDTTIYGQQVLSVRKDKIHTSRLQLCRQRPSPGTSSPCLFRGQK